MNFHQKEEEEAKGKKSKQYLSGKGK